MESEACDQVKVCEEDVDYQLECANRYLLEPLARQDVISTFLVSGRWLWTAARGVPLPWVGISGWMYSVRRERCWFMSMAASWPSAWVWRRRCGGLWGIGLLVRTGELMLCSSIVPIKANKEFNNYWIQKNRDFKEVKGDFKFLIKVNLSESTV